MFYITHRFIYIIYYCFSYTIKASNQNNDIPNNSFYVPILSRELEEKKFLTPSSCRDSSITPTLTSKQEPFFDHPTNSLSFDVINHKQDFFISNINPQINDISFSIIDYIKLPIEEMTISNVTIFQAPKIKEEFQEEILKEVHSYKRSPKKQKLTLLSKIEKNKNKEKESLTEKNKSSSNFIISCYEGVQNSLVDDVNSYQELYK